MRKRWLTLIDLIRENGYKAGVEIGVKSGENILHILRACPNFNVVAIDCWDPKYQYQNWRQGAQQSHEKRFDAIVAQFPDRILKMKGWSKDFAPKFDDDSLDLIFIDADHSYEAVFSDLLLWFRKVRSGGIICGHDYGHPKIGQVKKAVDEYLGKVEVFDDFVWVFKKK